MVILFDSDYSFRGRVIQTFKEKLPRIPEGYICDAGCSEGLTTNELTKLYPLNRVIGIDISTEAINKGRTQFPALDLRIEDMFTFFEKTDISFAGTFIMNNLWLGLNSKMISFDKASYLLCLIRKKLIPSGVIALSSLGGYIIFCPDSRELAIKSASYFYDSAEYMLEAFFRGLD